MRDFDKTVKYRFNKSPEEAEISNLQHKLNELEGIDSFEITDEGIFIEYLPFKHSKESLEVTLKEFGYPVTIEKKKRKGLFARFIDNLAKSNKEAFGNKKLDCCELKAKKQ